MEKIIDANPIKQAVIKFNVLQCICAVDVLAVTYGPLPCYFKAVVV